MVWILLVRARLYLSTGSAIAGIDQDRVDAALLGQGQGLEDLRLGVVRLEEFGDVDQIAAVRPAADEVAAHKSRLTGHVADLAAGHGLASNVRLFLIGIYGAVFNGGLVQFRPFLVTGRRHIGRHIV